MHSLRTENRGQVPLKTRIGHTELSHSRDHTPVSPMTCTHLHTSTVTCEEGFSFQSHGPAEETGLEGNYLPRAMELVKLDPNPV